jgi:hypothetical protein
MIPEKIKGIRLLFVILFAIVVNSCGSGGGSDGSTASSTATSTATSSNISGLTAKTFPSQINIAWQDTDNLDGIKVYSVFRKGSAETDFPSTPLSTTQNLGYQDRFLSESTSYDYKIEVSGSVEADLLDNIGTYSTTKRRIKLEVYESNGIETFGQPVQAFIPKNELDAIFSIKDGLGNSIPAQFWIRSRWYSRDNSIKELVAVFNVNAAASIGMNSEPGEYFLEHGSNSIPTDPVLTQESQASIVVSNENVEFIIDKSDFNLIDVIKYKGTTVIQNDSNSGHFSENRFNETYLDTNPCNSNIHTKYEIVESGPIRARIRIERPSYSVISTQDSCFGTFKELYEPVPGFVAWIDLYQGSDEIFVNYNMLNNTITPYLDGKEGVGLKGWPYFFETEGFSFKNALANPSVNVLIDGSRVPYTNEVFQASNDSVLNNNVNVGSVASGIIINDDAVGFAIIDPLGSQEYPISWKYDSVGDTVTYYSSPNGCASCEGLINDLGGPSNSGLYVLDDMSVKSKRFVIKLFPTSGINNINANLVSSYFNPVAVSVSVKDLNSIGTSSDLFGVTQPFSEFSEAPDMSFSSDEYSFHQQLFGLNLRRYRSCTTGSLAYTAMDTLMKRPPSNNLWAINIYDDLKRSQVIPRYWSGLGNLTEYNALQSGPDISTGNPVLGHESTEFSTSGYCKNSPIRAFYGNNSDDISYIFPDLVGKTFPAGYPNNISMTAYPRDNAHLWMQQLSDAPVDNPMLPYFKRRYENYLQAYAMQLENASVINANSYESAGDKFPTIQIRAFGHSLITLVDFYSESGNPDSLLAIESMLDSILARQRENGGLSTKDEFSFQDVYVMIGAINAMMIVSDDHDIYQKSYSYLYGNGEYREGLPGIVNAFLSVKFGYYDKIGCRELNNCKPADSGSSMYIDPLTIFSLLTSIYGETTPVYDLSLAINSHLLAYLDNEYGGNRPARYSLDWQNDKWQGGLIFRTNDTLFDMLNNKPFDWLKLISFKEGSPFH